MKTSDSFVHRLVMQEMVLSPGGEWSPTWTGWLVIHVSAGIGYCLQPQNNSEIQTGSVVVASDQTHASFRASQVGELRLHFFRTEPAKLSGLVTLGDQKALRDAARDPKFSLRVLPPNPRVTEEFMRLGAMGVESTLPVRVQLLQLFLEVFDGKFEPAETEAATLLDARERLKQTLRQTPLSDLVTLGLSGLVTRARCSPRHASRLFTELVGVSFREKQTELRLGRACELLATTDSKVAEVALECGYQSVSLFSVMFKQRFGITPAKWREKSRGNRASKLYGRRLRMAA